MFHCHGETTATAVRPRKAPKRCITCIGRTRTFFGRAARETAPPRAKREDVDAVLAKLKESGYLNDRHFAENYAAARLQNQGLGKMRVLRDLRQRRVAPKLAEQVTEQTYQQTE